MYGQEIGEIKSNVLLAYLTFPLRISKTLRPGIVALADALFPQSWDDLLTGTLNYVLQFPNALVAALKLIQSISHKYTYESRSDPLYEEIIIVCDTVHDFLLELAVNTLQRVMQNPSDGGQVVVMEVVLKVFYNLNYQDLHPKFEDNLSNWMGVLKQVMGLQHSSE
jgi:exportin-2 (importin alpha re-exporter)